jgi:hypothetical protein
MIRKRRGSIFGLRSRLANLLFFSALPVLRFTALEVGAQFARAPLETLLIAGFAFVKVRHGALD